MPSSGARSGTKPSRSDRPRGGKGTPTVELTCGHSTSDGPLAEIGDKKLYSCPAGCSGLMRRKS